jgi:hypothetical protein
MSANTIQLLTQRVELLEKQLTTVLAKSDDVKPKKEKKTKKEKKDDSSDDEKPKKKRVSGYILFSNSNRDDVKNKLMTGDDKPKNTEVMKELAVMWKALTDEERGEWNTKAQELKNADN